MMERARKTTPAPTWGCGFEGISGLVPADTSHRWHKGNSQLLAALHYARQHP